MIHKTCFSWLELLGLTDPEAELITDSPSDAGILAKRLNFNGA
jgi:hypothetical protein